MDKQKQHDELVSTLKEATASICGTIQTSINYLRSEMASCFNQLFSQMEKQHSEIMSSLSKISDNISENNLFITIHQTYASTTLSLQTTFSVAEPKHQ